MDIESSHKDDDILYAEQESSSLEDYSSKSLLNSPSLRIQFVRKVYSILLTQLSATALMATAGMYNPTFGSYLTNSTATLIFAVIFSIIILISMICFKQLSKIVPTNYILLTSFTLCESYIVSFACACFSWTDEGLPFQEGRDLVIMAALLTLGVTVAITVYAFTTKDDFTILGGLLFIIIACLSLTSLLLFFYSVYLLELVLCSLSAITYGIYIIYDTQLIVGGKRLELSIDDYIIGALMLYVDIIRLFLRILEILAKSKKK